MASLAQTATANANSAANSASNAAESANQAAASANAAAASASQVAADVQQKADSGAFNGKNGLDAPQIDDAKITTTNPWSSMQIVKTLCPPFTVSGAMVQCTPVANYPLGVQVEIAPTQEGTGDPSPENVRPIVGWDAVNVWRGGKNLCDGSLLEIGGYGGATGRPYQTDTRIRTAVFSIPCNKQFYLSFLDGYIVTNSFLYGKSQSMNKTLGGSITNNKTFNSSDADFFFATSVQNKAGIALTESDVTALAQSIQLELGSIQTSYEPYRGETYTIQLGQTIYGGTLDVGTGTLTVTHGIVILNSNFLQANNWIFGTAGVQTTPCLIGAIPGAKDAVGRISCSHFKETLITPPINNNEIYAKKSYFNYKTVAIRNDDWTDLQTAKNWLDAQENDGNPVQIIFELNDSFTIQLIHQQITSISGTNTLFADAGDITVTGASDPIATITALQDRVSALESAQTNM